MSSARELVINHITSQARRFPELHLAPLATIDLDPRDAALALAIDHAVARRWLTLAAIIESQLSRPWDQLEEKLQAVLLCGAAQLLFLDRIPDHAAINESVEWAKTRVRTKAGGLVNAVLRKVAALRREVIPVVDPGVTYDRDLLPLHDGRAWRLAEPVFADDPMRRLAQQTSHPESLIAHWITAFGQPKAFELAIHNLIHAPIMVHGALDDVSATELESHQEDGFFILKPEGIRLREWMESHSAVIIQDPASAAPVLSTAQLNPPPHVIIDACAGRGTKTRQLAMAHPQASIITTDIETGRLASLRDQFAGAQRIKVVEYRDIRQFDGQADLLVLDVPCSNTGVLARRVEAKYRLDPGTMKSLIDLQRQIVADSLPLLATRGRLLYSTCSVEPVENQQQAQWVCKWHPFRLARSESRWPTGLPGDPARQYSDGGFFSILERAAT